MCLALCLLCVQAHFQLGRTSRLAGTTAQPFSVAAEEPLEHARLSESLFDAALREPLAFVGLVAGALQLDSAEAREWVVQRPSPRPANKGV